MKPSDLVPKKVFNPKAQTVEEFCREVGIGRNTAMKMLKILVDEKRVIPCWRKINGRPVPAYLCKSNH